MKKYTVSLIVIIVLAAAAYFGYQAYLSSKIRNAPIMDLSTASSTTYTLADISAHKDSSDCWTVVAGNVYDLTSFIPSHPGGKAILPACGKDGTSLFGSVMEHGDQNAWAILNFYQIGVIAQ